MKYLKFTVLSLILFSCSTKRIDTKKTEFKAQKKSEIIYSFLSEEEIDIVNTFLQFELTSDKYKTYQNLEKLLIEEAKNRTTNLDAYDYTYKDWHRDNITTLDDNVKFGWILDSIQVQKLREQYKNDTKYSWKKTDIKNFKFTIIKSESFVKTLNTGSYINAPQKLIIYISRPLIIDKNNAFITFASGNSQLGFSEITHFTVLMKKVKGKWERGHEYFDGVFH